MNSRLSRVGDINDDEMLSDPLPQPYRFINKLLLRVIEDSIELAEDGGNSSNDNFICHNLRLTKVGRIPYQNMEQFFLSTEISQSEITSYSVFANTKLFLVSTSNGSIFIYDLYSRTISFQYSLSTLQKGLSGRPITQIVSLQSDYGNFGIALISEELCYFLLLSPSYQVKWTTEIDISEFFLRTTKLSVCGQNFIISDGNGKIQIFSGRTPQELSPDSSGNQAKSQPKQTGLEPILDIDRCPISTGPLQAQAPQQQKIDEKEKKKVPPRKKQAPATKGKTRAKSPADTAPETPEIVNHFEPQCSIFNNNVVVMFGQFPIIQLYNIEPPSDPSQNQTQLICEFPLPSPVSAILNVPMKNTLILGLENGTFCFLNVERRQVYGHYFLKKGKIINLLLFDNCLVVYTALKVIASFKLENMRATEVLYQMSDNDILSVHQSNQYIFTYNQKPADLAIRQSLVSTATFQDRITALIPNVSVLDASTGRYIGTISTPSDLNVETSIWCQHYMAIVYADPVDENLTRDDPQSPQKDVPEPAAPSKKPEKKESKKQSRKGKKDDVLEETHISSRKTQIIGFVDLEEFANILITKIKETEQASHSFAKKSRNSNSETPRS